MKYPNLNKTATQIPEMDYSLARRALKLRSESDKFRLLSVVETDKSKSRSYEHRADQLLQEREVLVARISPAGIYYNY